MTNDLPDLAQEIRAPAESIRDSVQFLKDSFADLQDLLHRYQAAIQLAEAGQLSEATVAQIEVAEEDADLTYLEENIPKTLKRALEDLVRIFEITQSLVNHPTVEAKAEA